MSLSPSKKSKYMEMPGNPNLLVIEEKEEEQEQDSVVTDFENIMYPLLYKSLQPLYTFIGYLEAESGKTLYYRYDKELSLEEKQNPLVKGAKSIAEFKTKNAHLGNYILRLLIEKEQVQKKTEKIKIESNISHAEFRDLFNRLIRPNASDIEMQAFPVRLWDVLPTSTFQFIVGNATFGAMEMAAKELKKDLRLLIISDSVNYMFAQFVCSKFISPKQNAFASGINGNGQMQYRISSGFQTSVMARTKWLLGCKLWFEDVIKAENPIYKSEIEPRRIELAREAQELYTAQLVADMRFNNDLVNFPSDFGKMAPHQLERFEQFLRLRQLPEVWVKFMDLKYEYDNLRLTHFQEVYVKCDERSDGTFHYQI